jgi:tetratricopeptide (TPR) repeat protein
MAQSSTPMPDVMGGCRCDHFVAMLCALVDLTVSRLAVRDNARGDCRERIRASGDDLRFVIRSVLVNLSRAIAAAAFAATLSLAGVACAITQEEADAMLAAQDWSGAAEAYEDLVQADRTNAVNWYNLGRARHESGDHAGARRAFERALRLTHPSPERVRFQLARSLMALGQRSAALQQIELLAGSPVPYRALLRTPEFETLQQDPTFLAVAERQRPCNTPAHHQFDFWVGEWTVTPSGAAPGRGAVNNITRIQEGCVVLENYEAGAYTGTSVNFYDAERGLWHQTWMANNGSAVYLEGGLNADGAMEMSDRALPVSASSGVINRVTWTPNADGSVRQVWHTSSDGGQTWSIVFDGLYTRRPASP